jgi:hypothetical protein
MTRILPPHPSPEHLKNEAKALLKAHRDRNGSVCQTLRLLHRFRDASDEQILAAEIALNEAQFALAIHYGFKSWEDLRRHVLSLQPDPSFEREARPGAFLLESPPADKSNTNRFARAGRLVGFLAESARERQELL